MTIYLFAAVTVLLAIAAVVDTWNMGEAKQWAGEMAEYRARKAAARLREREDLLWSALRRAEFVRARQLGEARRLEELYVLSYDDGALRDDWSRRVQDPPALTLVLSPRLRDTDGIMRSEARRDDDAA